MNAPLPVPKFTPVPNGKGCREKQRKAAAKFRNRLIDLMSDHGPLGARELAELGGTKVSTVRDHLDYLTTRGLVQSEKVKGKHHPTGGTVMCVYRLASDEATGPSYEAKQRTVHEYPLHHVRDFLVTALFGAAKQNGECHE